MDSVETMRVFVRVAQRAGFSKAARELRMSPAAVSKHIAALEARMGTRLLERTTRRVALTEAGRVYLERSLEALQAFADADASVTELMRAPQGVLRIASPIEFGQRHLARLLPPFMKAYPRIIVDLRLSNRAPDLLEEGIDVSLRLVRALSGQFVARPLAMTSLVLWAAPSYLRKHGRPKRPEDLAKHRHLVFSEPFVRDELEFERAGKTTRVKVQASMLSNGADALRVALHEGVGLMMLPTLFGREDYDAGLIEPVLTEWTLGQVRLFAVYPQRRFMSPKVRVFLELLKTSFGDPTQDPWRLPPRPARETVRAGRVPGSRKASHPAS